MQPAEAFNILQKVARSHPDFAQFKAEFDLVVDRNTTLPPEIFPEVIDALKTDTQLSGIIDSLAAAQSRTQVFGIDAGIGAFLVVAFLLRTHFRIKRTTSGKWEILIEYKPGDSKLITSVLKKLEEWLESVE